MDYSSKPEQEGCSIMHVAHWAKSWRMWSKNLINTDVQMRERERANNRLLDKENLTGSSVYSITWRRMGMWDIRHMRVQDESSAGVE